MNISGLENNYYLAFNDNWIIIDGFTEAVSILEITVTNITTGETIPVFQLSPSPENNFEFNICVPVRYLFPDTKHLAVNSLQYFQLDFNAKFVDSSKPDELISLNKFFVRGGRNRSSNLEWFLSSSEELIVGKWIEWSGISLPGFAKKIQDTLIVDFIPNNKFRVLNVSCDYKILKFLNSLGGYQYFIFEKYQIKTPSKKAKTISKKSNRLNSNNFKNTSPTSERSIEFQTLTPWEIQDVFTELVISPEVFLYHPDGTDDDSKWELLELENNSSIQNNWTRKYENKIEFSFANYYNITS